MPVLWKQTDLKALSTGSMLIAFCLIALWQCGYRPVGRQGSLPGDFTRLAIPLMENQTMEAGLEDIFTTELRRHFLADPRVEVTPLGEAEAVLNGKIEKLDLIILSYDSDGRISAKRASVWCEFELVHLASKETLWHSGKIQAEEEFPVTNDYLMNETYLEKALAEVAEDITETAHELLLSGF
jgi:hypothetical protein